MWYDARGGVKFECTACGLCCTRPGIIVFTYDDVARASARLGMSKADFRNTYLNFDGSQWIVDVDDGQPCHFLRDNKCSIHEVKPVQCASYPFWPELLESPRAWRSERKDCEGIGRGKLYSPDEIAERVLYDED